MSVSVPVSPQAESVLKDQAASRQSAFGLPLGKFDVDLGGQATYRLEIEVPPGIAKFQPKLALVYNHRQRNGVVGVGWAISAGSAIVRSRATYATDGFNGAVSYDANNRYSLDGERLINVDGEYGQPRTLYYTELQSWKHIRAGASPTDGFIVTTKNGEIWEYGTSPDSCILTPGPGSQSVRLWALTATTDRNGNRIEYSYTQSPVNGGQGAETGAYYLDTISYTIHGNAKANRFVRFNYEDRPDPITDYSGGFPSVTSFRLKEIVVSVGEEVIRSYAMGYRTSIATKLSCLESVTHSGSSSAGAPTLPPTKMVWQDVASPGLSAGQQSKLEQHLNTLSIQPMDVSGSGRTDVVQFWLDTDGAMHATVYLATPATGGAVFSRASDSVLGAFPAPHEIMAADLDGDGRTDLLIAYKSGVDDSLHLAAFLSNGTGFEPGETFKTGDSWSVKHLQFFAIDANGDGRTDLVEAYAHADPDLGDLLYFRTYLSQFGNDSGSMFGNGIISPTTDAANPNRALAFWAMDVNGDGMMDLVRVWQRGSDSHIVATSYIAVSTAIDQVSFAARAETDLGTFSLQDELAFLPVDVNGDGIQDLLQVWQEPIASGKRMHLTTFLCDATGGFVPGPDSTFDNQSLNTNALHSMSFSGGGQAALVSRWISGANDLMFTVFVGSPSGAFRMLPAFSAGSVGSSDLATYLSGDANGDGKADLIRIALDEDQRPLLVPYISAGAYPDLVTSITNSLGGIVEIEYALLSDASVYTAQTDVETKFPNSTALRFPNPLTPTQFPAQTVLGQALYVVSAYSRSNDPGLNRFNYDSDYVMSYSGARIDLMGRGWQGFRQIRKLNRKNGHSTIQTFNQDFPFTGRLQSTRIEADGRYASDPRVPKDQTSVLLSTASVDYGVFPRASGFDGLKPQIFEVLPTGSHSECFDYGEDQFDYAIGRTFAYDEYGNRTLDVRLSYIDRATRQPIYPNEVVYRHCLYQNDLLADGWALGFLRYAKTTANEKDSDITAFLPGDYRLEQRTYAVSTHNLASRGQWDDVHGQFLTTSYSYDAFGNRTSKTKPGGYVTHREYESDYNTFLMQTTFPANANANGATLTTQHGFDPRFGVEVARRDSNDFVSINVLDAFGRKTAHQGPVISQNPAASDANALSALVTGTADLQHAFLAAAVVTIETTQYLDDGQGSVFKETQSLQSFPTDSAREFNWKRSYVDGLGRERQTVEESGQKAGDIIVLTDYRGDGKGDEPARKSLPFFSPSPTVTEAPHYALTVYDILHRHIQHRAPSGPEGKDSVITTWQYGKDGQVTVVSAVGSDAAYTRILKHHFYDGKSKVQQAIVPGDDNATTAFEFDPLGRIVKATDPATQTNPAGLSNVITYDSLDRRLTADNLDQNTTGDSGITAFTYEYDVTTGKLLRQTDALGKQTAFAYDGLGRKTRQALSDGRTVVFVYDDPSVNGLGHLSRVTVLTADQSVESQYEFVYDGYANAATNTLSIAGEALPFVTTSTFDPQKRVIAQNMPDGSMLSLEYSFGNLVSESLDGARVDYPLEQYHPTGAPRVAIYGQGSLPGQGIVNKSIFNPAGQTYQELVSTSEGEVLHDSYQYDALSQLTEIMSVGSAESGESRNFTYHNQRLSTAAVPGFAPGVYDQDASDNIVSKDGVDYTCNGHFVVSGVADGQQVYSAAADACGRTMTRTANGATLNFDYDGLGCLRRITNPSGELVREILYDYRGRRLRQTDAQGITIVYVSPTYEVTRTAGGSTITKYLMDHRGTIAAITSGPQAQILYFRRDSKGSVTHTFDSAGSLVSRLAYSGYGESKVVSGPSDLRPRYEQRQWDSEIGLYYFGARYYDPVIGRFLTPDSQIGSHDHLRPGALNRYAFELNNPINFIDPTGHSAWWAGLIVGGLLIAAGIAVTVITAGAAAPAVAAASDTVVELEMADTAVQAAGSYGSMMGASAEAAADESVAAGTEASAGQGGLAAAAQGGARAALLKTVAGGFLIGGGTSGAMYSATHTGDDFSWKAFGIQSSISAVVGGITGGAYASSFFASFSMAESAALTAIVQGAADVVSQLATNAAEKEPLTSGLGSAAAFGVMFGAIAGALGPAFASNVDKGLSEWGSALKSATEHQSAVGRLFSPALAPATKSLRWKLLGQVLFANIVEVVPEALLENDISF